MEKKSKLKKWLPWIIPILVALFLAALPLLASAREIPSEIQASIHSAAAEERDIDTLIIGGGQLESSGVFNVKIPENVKIKEFLVGNGDTVLEGDPIARVDKVSVMSAISQIEETIQELSDRINEADNAAADSVLVSKPGGRVKKIYAAAGDSAADVMLQHGALAVVSLDDVMAVKINTQSELNAGDKVFVEINGATVTGRVKANVNGQLTVTVEDNRYEIGTLAGVYSSEGAPVGQGELYVYNAWNVTAYSGTVQSVYVSEQQTVYENQSLFAIKETGKSPDYQKNIDKRRKYETLMQELFVVYKSGVLTAPCDGIVSGIDTGGAYMMAADPNSTGIVLMPLSEIKEPITIVTKTLANGTQGTDYTAFLQAARGEEFIAGTWGATGLPGGLSIDAASGMISGTPTVAGTFNIIVSFKADGEDEITQPLTLTIEEKQEEPTQYTAYPAQVTVAGGNVIKVKQSSKSYTVTDLEKLPDVTVNPKDLTTEATYDGQTVVDGNFAVGDTVWIILDGNGKLVKVVKISQNKENDFPGGNNRPGIGGMSGMPNGMGDAAAEEDDGLYSLDKLMVATVTSQEKMTVSISIDELDITKIYVGQKATITMNAFAGEPVEAVVKKIANSGENSGGNSKFTVELELQKSSEMLPGMNATAKIKLETAEKVLCVPASAVYELDGNTVVYTSYDEKTESLGTPIPVITGHADADWVEIVSGLENGVKVFYEVYESLNMPSIEI